MKEGIVLTIVVIVFLYAAWVATGGPSRAMSTAGPWITPVMRPGEEQQGYRTTAPVNPVDPSAYPRQVGNVDARIQVPHTYSRENSGNQYEPPTTE